jgi:peptidoglycan/xylan/chitin deacetylase (PgdA/CDA1 family)
MDSPCTAVLLYHHVDPNYAITPGLFDWQMKYLQQHGYSVITLSELIESMKGPRKLPKKSVVITFDDGFLNTWTYAYPILKKYRFKATLFMITGLAGENPEAPLRFNMDDVLKRKCQETDLYRRGELFYPSVSEREEDLNRELPDFLSWRELKIMEESRVMDVQSHSRYHQSVYQNEKIVEFHIPAFINRKWSIDGDCRLGVPMYQRSSALAERKYMGDPYLAEALIHYVNQNGGKDFFKEKEKAAIDQALLGVVETYKAHNPSKDSYEDESLWRARVRSELLQSKQDIETRLGKICRYLAWPWGIYTPASLELAKEVGYEATVTTGRGANTPGSDVMCIKRFRIWRPSKLAFILGLRIHTHPILAKVYGRVYGWM